MLIDIVFGGESEYYVAGETISGHVWVNPEGGINLREGTVHCLSQLHMKLKCPNGEVIEEKEVNFNLNPIKLFDERRGGEKEVLIPFSFKIPLLDNVARLCPSFAVKGDLGEFGVRSEVRFTASCGEGKEFTGQICYSKSFRLFPLWRPGILLPEDNQRAFEQKVKIGCTSVGCFCEPEMTIIKIEGLSKVSLYEANMKIPIVVHVKASKIRKPRNILISLLELVSIKSHKVLYALEPIGTKNLWWKGVQPTSQVGFESMALTAEITVPEGRLLFTSETSLWTRRYFWEVSVDFDDGTYADGEFPVVLACGSFEGGLGEAQGRLALRSVQDSSRTRAFR